MFKYALAVALILAAGSAEAADTCKSTAIDKNGKPLAGAALNSFMTKCTNDATAKCTAAAIDKNGKPLAGAAKTSNITKCVKDAVGA